MKRIIAFSAMILMVVCVSTACSRGSKSSGGLIDSSAFSDTEEGAKEQLHALIKEHIQSNKSYSNAAQVPVIRRRPYYLKEYSVYLNGPEEFEISFRELESKTRPLMAEVTIEKLRFSTRMHRKSARAREDHEFVRDTGVEKLVYELHNGRWTRIGAIFDAKTTEEQVNGDWVPKREELERVRPEDQQPGWFGRLWNRIRGEE